MIVCKSWKKVIEDPSNQPASIFFCDPKHMSCLRALNGRRLALLEVGRQTAWDGFRDGSYDMTVTINCILARASSLEVQYLIMDYASPGRWALGMSLWTSLKGLRINFAGVYQLEDNFCGFPSLKVILVKSSGTSKSMSATPPDTLEDETMFPQL